MRLLLLPLDSFLFARRREHSILHLWIVNEMVFADRIVDRLPSDMLQFSSF
jgi:hypothetical protein